MPPTVTKDVVFRAVLALDSFNRGYNAPVFWRPNEGIPAGLGIGNATQR